MAGLFEAPLGEAIIGKTRASSFRRVRHGSSSIHIDADDELGIVLNLSEHLRVTRRRNGRTASVTPRVGAVTLMPPGHASSFQVSGDACVLMLRLPWAGLLAWYQSDQREHPDRLDLEPLLAFEDPLLARHLICAAAACPENEPNALWAVASHLFENHTRRPHPARHRAGLSPRRLRRVIEQIEESTGTVTPLHELAAIAGLSVFHFAREFKRVTGFSPYEFALRRRLAWAIELLGSTASSVADVAAATGFTHASHLARHTRRVTGLSPARLRAEILM